MTIDFFYIYTNIGVLAVAAGVLIISLGMKHRSRIKRNGIWNTANQPLACEVQQTEGQNEGVHIHDSDERFRLLAENIPGVIYLCNNDEEYSIIYINDHVESMTGYKVDEFEDGTISLARLIHPEDKNYVVEHVDQAVRANRPFELTYRLKHKNGSWKWIKEYGIGVHRYGEPAMLEGFITDITTQKKIENALKESEERLRNIVEKSNDGIYVIQGKQFVMVNKKFMSMFGYTTEEIISPDFTFMNLLDEESIPLIEERRKKRERGEKVSDRITFVGRTRERKKIHLEASMSAIEWEGKPGVLGMLRDVTLQKQLEEQLRHSQKIEAVGRVAGGLAHDFNNILTAISGYADLVSMQVSDEAVKNNVQEIVTASERATDLVKQLLAFSRRNIAKPVPVNLNNILTAMHSLLRRVMGEEIRLHTHLDDSLGTIEIDPALVEQVIMNLVINARDAMPEGGELTIETYNTELSRDYCELHPDVSPGTYVAVSITDTGTGIPEDIRDRIYEPFFTTKEKGKGTGLGLSTVYGIVKQSDGHIFCYSEIGCGTTFKIYFPRVSKDVKKTRKKKSTVYNDIPRGKNEIILLAEDEDSVRQFCSTVLKDLGYTILEARDGNEALEFSRQHNDDIHLLVADIMMPGMNGKELADKLCEERTSLKVILMSGYTNNVMTSRNLLDLGTAFIQKPFTPQTLALRVREVLDKKRN